MACDTFTQFPDGALLMVLDGEADPALIRHIDQCADCTARLRQLRQTNSALRTSLFRAACPPSLQLGEYSVGLSSASETTLIETHLAMCPHCAAELRQLDAFMALPDLVVEPSRPQPLGERVQVLIARLVSGLNSIGQPAMTPAFAALRGSIEGPVTYEAGQYRAVIEIDGDLDRPDRYALTGLLIGPAVGGVSVELWRGGQRLATTAGRRVRQLRVAPPGAGGLRTHPDRIGRRDPHSVADCQLIGDRTLSRSMTSQELIESLPTLARPRYSENLF